MENKKTKLTISGKPKKSFKDFDTSKTQAEIGWAPRVTFEEGLARTVDWYLERIDWWEQIIHKKYDGSRLGLRKSKSI